LEPIQADLIDWLGARMSTQVPPGRYLLEHEAELILGDEAIAVNVVGLERHCAEKRTST
jgi:hypothetical protein